MKMIDVKQMNGRRRYTVRKPLRKFPGFAIFDKETKKVVPPFMVDLGTYLGVRSAFIDRRAAWWFLREADAEDSEEIRQEKFNAISQLRLIRETEAMVTPVAGPVR